MAIALVQSAKGSSSVATTTATFSVTPTNGNLIVLMFAGDDLNGTPDSGWTESTGMEQTTFCGGYLWWRIAAGGTNSFPYTIGSASHSSWMLMEFSGVAASPYDISAGTLEQFSGSDIATSTITPTSGDRLLLAGFPETTNAGDMSAANTYSYSNSFTEINTIVCNSTSPYEAVHAAYRLVTANGSTGYTTTSTGTNVGGVTATARTALIIAFKASGGAATFNESRTETVTTSDTETSAATFQNVFAESVTSATTQTSTASFANTLAESVTSGDTFVGNTQLTITDSVVTGEAATSLATFANTRAESVASGDAETSLVVFPTVLTEAATTSDTWNGIGGTTMTETSTSGDTFTSVLTGVNALVETAITSDTPVPFGANSNFGLPGSGSSSSKARKKFKKRVTLWEAPAKKQVAKAPEPAPEEEEPRSDPMIAGRAPDFANLFGMVDGGVPNEPAILRPKPTVQQDIAALVRLMHLR